MIMFRDPSTDGRVDFICFILFWTCQRSEMNQKTVEMSLGSSLGVINYSLALNID